MDSEMKGDTSQGDDGTEIPNDHPQEDILMPQKIVSCNAGFLQFENENLAKILEVSKKEYTDDYPVAFLAVLGPPQSGKSFVTNLMIRCSRDSDNGGWLEELVNEGRFQEGFHFGSVVSSKELFEPSETKWTSGIYLWPKPYLKKKPKGDDILLWILHYQISGAASLIEEDVEMIETLLGLVCSRILELFNRKGELRIAKIRSLRIPSPPTDVCGSVVILAVENEKNSSKPLRGDKAKDKILELMQIPGAASQVYASQLDKFQHINLVQMKKIQEALHDEEGRFKYDVIKPVIKPYKDAVNELLMEVEEIIPKKFRHGGPAKLSNISEFLGACVNSVNHLRSQNNKALTKEKLSEEQLLQLDLKECEVTIDICQEVATNVNDLYGRIVTSEAEDTEPSSTSSARLNGIMVLETNLDEPEPNISQSNATLQQPKPKDTTNKNDNRTEVKDSITEQKTPHPDNSCIKDGSEECSKMEVDDEHFVGALHDHKSTTSSVLVTSSEGNGEYSHTSINIENMEIDEDGHSSDKQKLPNEKQMKEDEEERRKKEEEEERQKKEEGERRKKEEEERRKKQEAEKQERKKRKEEEERKRLEMERQQREKDLELFNECLPKAIAQIKQMVPTFTKYWISIADFNPQTVYNYQNVYDHCFKEVLDHNHQNVIAPYLWNDFLDQVHARCYEVCMPFLIIAFDPVCKFTQEIGRQLDLYAYFCPEKFAEIASLAGAKYLTEEIKNNNFTYEITCSAIDRILSYYTATNAVVMESEMNLRENLGLQMKNFYNEEMKGYLKKHGGFTRNVFEQIHSELLERLINWSRKIVNPTTGDVLPADAQQWISELENELREMFGVHRESNEMKLKKLRLEINKLVSSRYDEYVWKMEEILRDNLEGLERRKLEKVNKAILEELTQLLKIDIKNKIRESEPTEGYCDALKYQILQYWETVSNVNENNLAKALAENRRRQHERKLQEEETKRSMQTHHISNKSNVTRRRMARRREPGQWQKQLDPLIFRLSGKHIFMATTVNGEFKVIQNINGEIFTPSIVGINEHGDLVYGTDAVVQCTSGVPQRRHWWIGQFLGGRNSSSNKEKGTFNVGDICATYDIGVEFILGFIMRSLKETAEQKLEGSFSTALIAVPFWFCSTQRLQMKDAARVAGFSDVYLVNEESCAAYALASYQLRAVSSGRVLVLSENYGIVTAVLYTYCIGNNHKKVTMDKFSVCNTMKAEVAKKGISTSLVWYVWYKFREFGNFLLGGTPKEKHDLLDPDLKIKLAREVCKSLFEKRRHEDMWPSDAIFVTNSKDEWDSEWYRIFETVVREKGYGRIALITGKDPLFVGMFGASMLAGRLAHVTECIKDSMYHDVYKICTNSKGSSRAITAEEYRSLPLQSKKHQTELPKGMKKARFFQENIIDGSNCSIGELAVGPSVSYGQQIFPVFEINSEAIVTMNGVKCEPAIKRFSKSEKEDMTDYTWTPYAISDTKREDIRKIINQLFEFWTMVEEPEPVPMEAETEENDEIKIAKAMLETKCTDMEQGIYNNVYNFKTEVSIELFKKKIEKAKALLKNSDVTIESLKNELDVLEKACSKYSTPK